MRGPPRTLDIDARTGWGLLLLVFAAAALLPWANRYLLPTVNPGVYFFSEWTAGRMPYRDYFLPIGPAAFLESVLVHSSLGPGLMGHYLAATALRLASLFLLYRLLIRRVPPPIAAGACLLSWILCHGDDADSLNWYQHQVAVHTIFSAYAAVRCCESARSIPRILWAAACGLFLFVAFAYKQTYLVLAASLGFGLLAAALARHRWPGCLQTGMGLGAGFGAGVFATALWLASIDALPAAFGQIFISGPQSKGGALSSLLRPFTIQGPTLLGALVLFYALFPRLWEYCRNRLTLPDRKPYWRPLHHGLFLLSLGLVLTAVATGRQTPRIMTFSLIYTAELGCLLGFLHALRRASRGERNAPVAVQMILCAAGASHAFALSMSWYAYEPMLMPSFAIAGALLFHQASQPARWILGVAVFIATGFSYHAKLHRPAFWGNWREPPVWTADTPPRSPLLKGFLLSPATARFYDRTIDLLRQYAGPERKALIHPHMYCLYGLSGTHPATFAYQHWMDVCPDDLARSDAEIIRRNPPPIIVYMQLPTSHFDHFEDHFRKGGISGQRIMNDAITGLLQGGIYEKVEEFTADSHCPVSVWVQRRLLGAGAPQPPLSPPAPPATP